MSEVEMNEPLTSGYSVTLPTFEGPLDLLLHLCQKHELDILDIPIGFVTEKYLEYLAVMQLMNLDVASEYLVMAATLAHIKSKMLLPAPPPGQEDELAAEEQDPREALIRRLLEYQKYKHAGEELSTLGVAQQNVFMRGVPIEEAVHTGLPPLAQVPLFSLVEAFQVVLSKSKVKLSHDIVHERVTLADRINELVDVLRVKRRVAFEELFEGLNTRFDLVITFLALLEMTRLRMTRLFQADFDSQIFIEFTAQVTEEQEQMGELEGNAGEREDGGSAELASEEDEIHRSVAEGLADDETTDVRAAFHIEEGIASLDDARLDDTPPSDEATEMRTFDLEATAITADASELRAAVFDDETPVGEPDEPAPEPTDPELRAASPQTIPSPPPEGPGNAGEAAHLAAEAPPAETPADEATSQVASSDEPSPLEAGSSETASNESTDTSTEKARDDAGDENT